MPDDAGVIRVDDSTNSRPRARARRQRSLHPTGSVFWRAACTVRGLSQRRGVRCGPIGDHRLPELRLARRPRGDVAVHRGDPRHRRWLRRAGDPGDRRQRELLQPDRLDPDQPDAGDRRARRDFRRAAAPVHRVRCRRRADLPARRDARRVRRIRVGARRARAPRRPPAARRLRCRDRAGSVLHDAVGLVSAAHDLSDGGLAQALVESCLRGGRGARITLPADVEPFVALFSESAARAIVAVAADRVGQLVSLAAARGVPLLSLGTTGGETLDVAGQFAVDIAALRAAAAGTFPALFG